MLDIVSDRASRFEEEHAERVLGQAPPPSRAESIRARLLSLDRIQPVLGSNYLVKGWLPVGTFSVLYGASNVGKTFVVLDMAMHIAAGVDWFETRVSQGAVVYVAAEGGFGIKNRLAALMKDRPEFAGAPFYLLPDRLDLNGNIDPEALAEAVSHISPALIVIDTLARSMGDGNENATQDMNRFVAAVDRIRQASGAHVLVVHHSGKNEDNGARGSTALRAAADAEICVSEVQNSVPKTIEIKATKQRDYETPRPICVSLRSVDLGVDQDGDSVTSAVVESADFTTLKRKALKGELQQAMHALDAALLTQGRKFANSDSYPASVTVVDISHWRDEMVRRELLSINEQGHVTSGGRSTFQRIKQKLNDANLIRMFDQRVWRCSDE